MNRLPLFAALFAALLAWAALAPPAEAQDAPDAQDPPDAPDAVVEVDGLACPFCAYGLEKKLGKVDGVKSLNVKIDAGKVEIVFEDGQIVEKAQIREAVAEAGFTARKITYPGGRPRNANRSANRSAGAATPTASRA